MSLRTMSISALVVLAGGTTAFGQFTGPSSSQSPYLLPSISGVSTTSIFTVGDTIGGYRMVGIPDGLGAWQNAGQTSSFNVVMNHELGGSAGAVRAHGQTGAFVSRWEIGSDLSVISGRDHNTSAADAFEWTGTEWSNTPSSAQRWSRFCSADLAAPSAFRFGDLGTDARIYLTGEEAGAEGRAYAHIVSGSAMNQSWHLPALGRFSWENSIAAPLAQQKTIVAGLDDSGGGEVYFYVGDKTNSGNDITRAGLTNGNLFGLAINGYGTESRGSIPAAGTSFTLAPLGNQVNVTGAALEAASGPSGTTNFARPEDGQWDPRPGFENNFYFVTTDDVTAVGGRSRLWKATFNDITNPTAGGTVEVLLDGTEGGEMFDNMTIDSHGRVFIQEDPGTNNRLSKIWMYDLGTENFLEVAAHDATRFAPGAPQFLTTNEESSGIIDAKDILGDGWFLLDVQAHYAIPGELVEGGQLLAMYVDPSLVPAPGAVALVGMAGLVGLRRRR